MDYQLLQRDICEAMGITLDQMHSKCRYPEYTISRQAFCYFLYLHKRRLRQSLRTIGNFFGKKHDFTIHARNKFKDLLDTKDEQAVFLLNIMNEKHLHNVYKESFDYDLEGFISFKFPPFNNAFIEVKNGLPFAIGFYKQDEGVVKCHGSDIKIEPEYEWRYYK